uniref:Insulin-like domain-containing protein n=1 Tax=Clytia hemisphaerica TaxID=252671 RepID=A0A7M5UW94_9CNID
MKVLTILAFLVLHVLNTQRVEANKEISKSDKSGLHCLCGDTFIKAYQYCCKNASKCKAASKIVKQVSHFQRRSARSLSNPDFLLKDQQAKQFLKTLRKPSKKSGRLGYAATQDNASEECCYEWCNLKEVSEYCSAT